MKKLQSLHTYLLSSGLVTPEQLKTVVTEGTVVFPAVSSPADDVGFLRRYTAEVRVIDWGGEIDQLDAALCWWLGLYQPELAGMDKNSGYGFEADILNTETVTLYTLIPLTERVRYDRTTGEMINCVQPLVWDDQTYPPYPAIYPRHPRRGDNGGGQCITA